MPKTILSKMLICALVIIVILLNGCEGDQGPAGPTGQMGPQGVPGPILLNIIATMAINDDTLGGVWAVFNMNVYNAPSIPHVTLNDTTVMPADDWMFEGGSLRYSRSMIPFEDDSAFLDVAYTRLDDQAGSATSEISVPSCFIVVDSVVTVTVNDDITVEWETSEGADAFWVYEDFVFEYIDTGGVEQVIAILGDTILSADDTALVVAASEIFPDPGELDSTVYFAGRFAVKAVTGPWFPGEANNFVGDAFGIFVGATEARHIRVDLSGPPAAWKTTDSWIGRTRYGDIEERFRQRVVKLACPEINE